MQYPPYICKCGHLWLPPGSGGGAKFPLVREEFFLKRRKIKWNIKKEWNAEEWEKYLKSIESPQTELLLDDPGSVESLSEEQFKEGVVNNMGQNDSAQLNKIVSLLIEGLTEKQKQVLHHLFWENRTQRETAQIMCTRHSSV